MDKKITVYREYTRELLILALPMILGNLGMILIGAGAVFVAARHSTDTLASISIANSIISCIVMFGVGLLASISPVLSNFRGQKKKAKKYFLSSIVFGMFLAFLSMFAIFLSIPLIERIGFEAKLMPAIKQFMFISAFSTFGLYLQVVLKEFLQAYEIVLFPNLLVITSVVFDVFLSFVFVFGLFGVPPMGAAGLALAALIMRTVVGLILLLYCLHFIKIKWHFDFSYCCNIFNVGLPISLAILLEFLAFNLITIVMGKVSGVYAGAQSILITITTATFMIPLSLSSAIAVKIGFANGSSEFDDLKRYAIAGTLTSVTFMAICALTFWMFAESIIKIFTSDLILIKICVPSLIIAGVFQVFDGLQVALGGVFKGLKRTEILIIGDIFAYWLVGIPLGFVLAFKEQMNLLGFWVGLAVSIFLLGMFFLYSLLKIFRKLNRDFTK